MIVDVLRTPFGRRGGMLAARHPADLLGQLLAALGARNGLDPALVEDVIVGCVMQIGAQSLNVGRAAVLAAGWPEHVSATTIDRQGASGQQALHFAAQGVAAGAYDVAVAAGVELMSMVPMGASVSKGLGLPFGPRVTERYRELGGLVPTGLGAELLAERADISRDEMDRWAWRSTQRAQQAQDAGWLEAGRLDLDAPAGQDVSGGTRGTARRAQPMGSKPAGTRAKRARRSDGWRDELVAASFPVSTGVAAGRSGGLSVEVADPLAALPAGWRDGGRVTAGNSAPIADGAGAALIMSEARAAQLGLVPRARFVAFATAGADPLSALHGPVPASAAVLIRAGLTMADIDAFEVHEDFAVTVLAWLTALDADPELVNADGGALAFGDPVGASGLRLAGSLLARLERNGGRYGLQTMAGGGGVSTAMILERLD